MGLVAFREEVTVFDWAGLVFDEFRKEGGNLVRGQGCLDGRFDKNRRQRAKGEDPTSNAVLNGFSPRTPELIHAAWRASTARMEALAVI